MSTLKITPFAATHDGEDIWHDDTKSGALQSAEEAWQLQLDLGEIDEPVYPHQLPVTLYTEAEWCTGPADPYEDCDCRGGHEDGRWLLLDWGITEEITHEVENG